MQAFNGFTVNWISILLSATECSDRVLYMVNEMS